MVLDFSVCLCVPGMGRGPRDPPSTTLVAAGPACDPPSDPPNDPPTCIKTQEDCIKTQEDCIKTQEDLARY